MQNLQGSAEQVRHLPNAGPMGNSYMGSLRRSTRKATTLKIKHFLVPDLSHFIFEYLKYILSKKKDFYKVLYRCYPLNKCEVRCPSGVKAEITRVEKIIVASLRVKYTIFHALCIKNSTLWRRKSKLDRDVMKKPFSHCAKDTSKIIYR